MAIVLAKVLQPYITHELKSLSYSISVVLRDILVLILPALIISSIYRAFVAMRDYSILFFPLIILFICGSNFLHVFGSLNLANRLITDATNFDNTSVALLPLVNLFRFSIPKVITNEHALYMGFFLGFVGYKKSFDSVERFISLLVTISDFVLKKIFVPMLPIFIFGMTLKMINDGVFDILIHNISLFYTMFIVLACYLFVLVSLAASFSIAKAGKILSNIAPALFTALSSMSSAMALPVSLKAAKKNTKSKGFSNFFMPATVNIHMIGDCIIIPFLMIIVMRISGMGVSVEKIPLFSLFFMLTKFSGAGVPGGTVFIMVPIMVKIFGFTPGMSLLITSMYIVVDPIATSISVMGNNLFVILFDKILVMLNMNKERKKI